jgi:hypothetical protein
MSHRLPLRTRVRYEGRATMIDRRPTQGADLDKFPNKIWYTVSQVLRANFRRITRKRR